MKDKKRILNDDIRARNIKLISDEWEQLWEMTLKEAKQKALEEGLDLMQMSENWWIAIVKLLDYGKFLYRQKKQEKKSKQSSKSPDLKTIRITFKISEHDLDVKKKQAEKFAHDNDNLKVMLQLRWRENQYDSIAREKMEYFVELIADFYKLEKPVARNWNNFLANFVPIK